MIFFVYKLFYYAWKTSLFSQWKQRIVDCRPCRRWWSIPFLFSWKGGGGSINIIYYSIPFLFSWKGGVGNLAALPSLVAQWVVITTIYSAAGGGWVVGLTIFCFQCWINIIVAPDFTVLKCMFVCVFVLSCLDRNFCTVYNIVHWFITECRGSSIDGFVVADGTVSCHYDNWWCHSWRRVVGWAIFCFQCSMYHY